MIIRNATPSDVTSIAALSIEVWVGTYLKQGVNAGFAEFVLDAFTPANIASWLEDADQTVFVSQNSDGIDGFIRVSKRREAPVAFHADTEISTFYVQPRHHGKGIGRALLAAAIRHCRDQSISAVWLATNAENASAIAFYLAQGFNAVGDTYFRIGQDAYLNTVFGYRIDHTPPGG